MSHYPRKAVATIRRIQERLEDEKESITLAQQKRMAAELEESLDAVIDSHFEIVQSLWESTKGTQK